MNETYRILAEGKTVSNDTRRTGLNNNDAVIGPSGCGKTRGYVAPNILQCTGSVIVTDTKGMLYGELRETLEKEGCRVQCLDLADCAGSPCGYNPLDYIRYDADEGRHSQQDILTLAACLIPVESSRDPYWERSARMYLESILAYILECLPEEEQDLCSAVRLLPEMGKNGYYRRLIRELEEIDPDSFAVNRYRLFSCMEEAERTNACIMGVVAEKLSAMSFDGAGALFRNPDKVDITALAREKTVLFLTVSDTDSSMYALANAFYTQAMHALCSYADRECPGHRLPVPVRFILDDFASNVCIPDFDRLVSVIRSREISASIILQSVSQLESLYGHAKAMTVMDNCDNCLYLGGQDPATARYISIKANRPASSILGMGLDEAWLFTRGKAPEQVRKYDLKKHPAYRQLPEYRRENPAAGTAETWTG